MIHTAITVRVYTADEIASRLKIILTTMDRAKARMHSGYLIEAHHIYRAAAEELHDMLCEVLE